MDSYEEYKNVIMAKSNTVAANKAREECRQKTADCVNLQVNIFILPLSALSMPPTFRALKLKT